MLEGKNKAEKTTTCKRLTVRTDRVAVPDKIIDQSHHL